MALEAYINWAGNVRRRMLEEGLRSMEIINDGQGKGDGRGGSMTQ